MWHSAQKNSRDKVNSPFQIMNFMKTTENATAHTTSRYCMHLNATLAANS